MNMGVLYPCKLDCCYLPFSPNVVPAPAFSAALLRLLSEREVIAKSYPIQTVIQLLIGKTKKPINRNIKNRRELYSRFEMMFYVSALKFKDGTVYSSIHSLTVPKRIEWWVTVFSLSIPQALGGCAAFLIQTSCIQL